MLRVAVKILLEFLQRAVETLPESDLVEFIQDRHMYALADFVVCGVCGLYAFGPGVLGPEKRETEVVRVLLAVTTELHAAIGLEFA